MKRENIYFYNLTYKNATLVKFLTSAHDSLIPVDGNGRTQDGAAERQPAAEPVSVPGTVPWLRTGSWSGSAWDGPTWSTSRHGTGTVV